MSIPLRALLIEDSEADAELLLSHLRHAGYEVAAARVSDAAGMRTALQAQPWDIIFSDHAMPRFSVPQALAVLKTLDLDLPFIIVSGDIRQNVAVTAMRVGAHDFIRKDELYRLVPAVERELREAEARRAHRQTEAALAESEVRLQTVITHLPIIVFATDKEGVITLSEGRGLTALNIQPGQLNGQSAFGLYHDQPVIIASLKQILAGKALTATFEFGDQLAFDVSVSPVKNADGAVTGLMGVAVDVTEQAQMEAASKQSQANLSALIESTDALIWSVDQELKLVTGNLAFGRYLAQSTGAALHPGLALAEVWPADRAARWAEWGQQALAGEPVRDEFQLATGRRLEVSLHPIIKDGDIIGVSIFGQDITERKQAEEQIRFNALRAQALAAAAQELAGVSQDYHAVLRLVTQQMVELVGDACLMGLLADNSAALVIAAADHADPPTAAFLREQLLSGRPASDTGLMAHVARTGQPVLLAVTTPEEICARLVPELAPHLARCHGHSALAVPFRAQGRTLGAALVLRERSPQPYTIEDQLLLQDLADRAALALTNARLFAEAQERLQHVEALRAIDTAITTNFDLGNTLNVVLEQVMSQLHVDAADVLLLNPETLTLTYAAGRGFRTTALQHTRLRMGESFAGLAALNRRTVNIPDLNQEAGAFMRSHYLADEEFVSYFGTPLIAKGQIKGVLEVFGRKAFSPNQEWVNFLETIAGQAAIALDNASLFEELQLSNIELMLAYDATIEGWSRALDLRDNETEGHSQRVTDLTLRLARQFGLPDRDLVHVRRGALLHDIGKMGIPDAILLKPGLLTEAEWAIMRQHPVYAHELIKSIAFLRPALDIPYAHHEKWDGTGYPLGLRGEAIPKTARIFAVVDVWDALCSDRPYRRAWPVEQVRTYLHEQAGRHFDPHIVQTFMNLEGIAIAG